MKKRSGWASPSKAFQLVFFRNGLLNCVGVRWGVEDLLLSSNAKPFVFDWKMRKPKKVPLDVHLNIYKCVPVLCKQQVHYRYKDVKDKKTHKTKTDGNAPSQKH